MSFCAVVMGSRKGVFCTTRRFDPGSTTFATTYDENPAQLSEIPTPTDELGLTPPPTEWQWTDGAPVCSFGAVEVVVAGLLTVPPNGARVRTS